MVLNSFLFLIFLAAVAVIWYLLPQKLQPVFLLIASYVFYMWAFAWHGITLLAATALSYGAGLLVARTKAGRARKAALGVSVVFFVALLIFFKYTSLFKNMLLNAGWQPTDLTFSVLVPVGIGFFTLQVIGYLVDVYRGKLEPERSFVHYALFVGFFPQMTSGPIGRAPELLPQFRKRHAFNYATVVDGLQRFLTGAYKKIVMADGLGILVNGVYANLRAEYEGLILLVAVVLYGFQLYFDFSGYTDMAVGAAKILGIELRENFRAPYRATNVTEFWTRWNMSLTSWLRDYVYFPLGGSRKGYARKLINLLLVFVVSGIWHGTGSQFVLWGLYFGIMRLLDEPFARRREIKPPSRNPVVVFLKRTAVFMITAVSCVFVRADSFSDTLYVLTGIFKEIKPDAVVGQILHLASNGINISATYYVSFFAPILIGFIIIALFNKRVYPTDAPLNALATYSRRRRWVLYWVMGISIMILLFIEQTGLRGGVSFVYGNF